MLPSRYNYRRNGRRKLRNSVARKSQLRLIMGHFNMLTAMVVTGHRRLQLFANNYNETSVFVVNTSMYVIDNAKNFHRD